MGAFLDKPKLEKATDVHYTKHQGEVVFAICSMQGWRIDMEDSHTFIESIGCEYRDRGKLLNWTFIAVFDGHAGKQVAEISSEELLPTLMNSQYFEKIYTKVDERGHLVLNAETGALVEEWLKSGFIELDNSMKARGDSCERSGTTAICAILTPQYVFFANLGDSRGLLCSKKKEIFATEDHKPYLEKERDRIVKAGGSVMIQRVNGSLAVSRALGDFAYKGASDLRPEDQLVSPEPEIYIRSREAEDEFLVLACDGIFDVFENNELCDLIRSRLELVRTDSDGGCGGAQLDDYKEMVEQILDVSLSKGSRDNMTIVLVTFSGAPKHRAEALVEEREWRERARQKIGELLKELEGKRELEADNITSRLLQEAELASDKAGALRVHLARPIIHAMISEHDSELQRRGKKEGSHSQEHQQPQPVSGSPCPQMEVGEPKEAVIAHAETVHSAEHHTTAKDTNDSSSAASQESLSA